jgi:hypothetical protein
MADTDNALPSVMEFSANVAEQQAPVPLPVRTYPAQCTDAAFRQSKSNPDNILLWLEFTIAPTDYPADYTETQDTTKLFYNRLIVNRDDARTRFQIRQLCDKMRVPVSRTLDANDFRGKAANLKIKHGSWEGLPRAEIDAIEPAS